MRQRIITLLIILSSFLVVGPGLALAADTPGCSGNLSTQQAIECGTNGAAGQNQSASQATNNLDHTLTNIIDIMSVLVGVISVVMIIIAGFQYITSGGKQESVTTAKHTLLYAIIGMVLVVLAQIIAQFVLSKTPH